LPLAIISYQKRVKVLIYMPFGTILMHLDSVNDLPRKLSRVHTPLPEDTLQRLEQLADSEARPVANMASVLVQAALELIDQQGFRLVEGKLRKISFEPTETDKSN
jgi:hypothetical protein